VTSDRDRDDLASPDPATETGGPDYGPEAGEGSARSRPDGGIEDASELKARRFEDEPGTESVTDSPRSGSRAVDEALAKEAEAVESDESLGAATAKQSGIGVWAAMEIARILLLLSPIVATWIALGLATTDYQTQVSARPDLAARAFFSLWLDGSLPAAPSFASVAFTNAALVATAVALTLALDVRRERLEAAARDASASEESIAATSKPETQSLADDLAELEGRITQLVAGREGLLTNLDTVVVDLKASAGLLATFGDRTESATQALASSQRTVARLADQLLKQDGRLASAVEQLARQIDDSSEGSGFVFGTSSVALNALAAGQERLVDILGRLVTAGDDLERSAAAVRQAVTAETTRAEEQTRIEVAKLRAGQEVAVAAFRDELKHYETVAEHELVLLRQAQERATDMAAKEIEKIQASAKGATVALVALAEDLKKITMHATDASRKSRAAVRAQWWQWSTPVAVAALIPLLALLALPNLIGERSVFAPSPRPADPTSNPTLQAQALLSLWDQLETLDGPRTGLSRAFAEPRNAAAIRFSTQQLSKAAGDLADEASRVQPDGQAQFISRQAAAVARAYQVAAEQTAQWLEASSGPEEAVAASVLAEFERADQMLRDLRMAISLWRP
jgi:hypothetical protein